MHLLWNSEVPNARLVVGTAPRLRTESLVLHRVRWAPRQFPWAEPHPSAAGGMRGEEPARLRRLGGLLAAAVEFQVPGPPFVRVCARARACARVCARAEQRPAAQTAGIVKSPAKALSGWPET